MIPVIIQPGKEDNPFKSCRYFGSGTAERGTQKTTTHLKAQFAHSTSYTEVYLFSLHSQKSVVRGLQVTIKSYFRSTY